MFPVEEFHLENILYNLNYKTKEMEKLKKSGLTTRSMTTIEEELSSQFFSMGKSTLRHTRMGSSINFQTK